MLIALPLLLLLFLCGSPVARATTTPPTITQDFGTPYIDLGQTGALRITITNPNATSLSGVSFTDALPAGLQFVALALTNGCGGGTVTGTPSSISLSNAVINGVGEASNLCVISVSYRAIAVGQQLNTISVTSTEADPGGPVTASVIVSANLDLQAGWGAWYLISPAPVGN